MECHAAPLTRLARPLARLLRRVRWRYDAQPYGREHRRCAASRARCSERRRGVRCGSVTRHSTWEHVVLWSWATPLGNVTYAVRHVRRRGVRCASVACQSTCGRASLCGRECRRCAVCSTVRAPTRGPPRAGAHPPRTVRVRARQQRALRHRNLYTSPHDTARRVSERHGPAGSHTASYYDTSPAGEAKADAGGRRGGKTYRCIGRFRFPKGGVFQGAAI